VFGLFMTEAAIASEIVRMIPLDDRNRDYLKENRDALESAKRDIEEQEKDRSLEGMRMPWEFDDTKKERARKAKEKIEKAIEKNKKTKKREQDMDKENEERREREKRDKDNFERGGWY